MTQLNINATDRFDYLSDYTWVVTSIPSGLQYTVTDDNMGIYITGTPARAGTYTMNVILLYWGKCAILVSWTPFNAFFEHQIAAPTHSSARPNRLTSNFSVRFPLP